MSAIDLAGAVLAMAGRGGPILIPDTCSLLDILRAPIRPQFHKNDMDAVARLLTLTEAVESGATLVLTGQVRRELESNTQPVIDEVERELRKTSETVHSILERMAWLSGSAPHPSVSFHQVGHPQVGRDLLDRLLARSLEVMDSNEAMAAAGERVAMDVAPSRKGKQSYKDCLVIETTLRVAAACREGGVRRPIVFLTANTSDYCEGTSLRLRPPLDGQFAAAGLEFQPRWAAIYRHIA
ncbi:PIN domain-containing protein [Roseomonas sp. USHLN139]|uniref:PIN domain-containing protein n=1 Tax=Roseomonas sp. USHLN139 TaxID=3081298 RepID=UPI003B028C5B